MKASCTLIAVFVAGAALVWCAAGALAEGLGVPPVCETPKGEVDRPAIYVPRPPTRYPEKVKNVSGEGYVRLGHEVSATGEPQNVWLNDIVGSPLLLGAAAASLNHAEFAPGRRNGAPVTAYGEFLFEYYFDDDPEYNAHPRLVRDLAWAKKASDRGDHVEAVEILRRTVKEPLTLREYADAFLALARAHWAQGDRGRALAAIRRAKLADRENKPERWVAILALLSELALRDNSLREGLCTYERLLWAEPRFEVGAELKQLLAAARRDLDATTPMRTEAEIVESDRPDLAAIWRHAVLRPTLRIEVVQGTFTAYKLMCPLSLSQGSFPLTQPLQADNPAGACTLFVFGDSGARFVLDER